MDPSSMQAALDKLPDVTVWPRREHRTRHYWAGALAERTASSMWATSSSESCAKWLACFRSESREIIGHDSVSVDRGYVHMDAPAMQTALDRLPDLTSMW